MNLIFAFLFFFTANAHAWDICEFSVTSDFLGELEQAHVYPVKTTRNHKRFTFAEKEMIHHMVSLNDPGVSQKTALEEFDGGEVVYFNFEGKRHALVHYWPGGNEYGAYYQVNPSGAFKLIASVGDSFITCK